MGLPNLVGIDPNAVREYTWIGDDAVDLDASDIPAWVRTGRGLAIKQGAEPCILRTRALTPTVLALVTGHAMMGAPSDPSPEVARRHEAIVRDWPAAQRAAVAYGVVEIVNGPKATRVSGPGGWRLADEVIDALDRYQHEGWLRLVGHLGDLILGDSRPTETERKP